SHYGLVPTRISRPRDETGRFGRAGEFVFAACQPGAERALKNDVARRYPDWRAAFARPGFVTFKLSGATADRVRLDSVFARTWGVSLGRIAAASEAELARATWERLDEKLG